MRASCVAFIVLALVCAPDAPAADRRVEPIVSRIRHQAVQSRALSAVGYSHRLHALEIEFHRGGTYRYLDVPPSVHRQLLAADSKANYYNRNIRGKYRAVRVRQRRAIVPNQ